MMWFDCSSHINDKESYVTQFFNYLLKISGSIMILIYTQNNLKYKKGIIFKNIIIAYFNNI